MGSPYLQSTTHSQRNRSNSNLSVQSAENRSGIRKRSTSRSPSVSATQIDRLHHLALNESTQADPVALSSSSSSSTSDRWTSSNEFSQPTSYPGSNFEPLQNWRTLPHSESRVPSFSIDRVNAALLDSNTTNSFSLDPPATTADMRYDSTIKNGACQLLTTG